MKDTKKTPKTTHHRDTEKSIKHKGEEKPSCSPDLCVFVIFVVVSLCLCVSVVSSFILCHFECILVSTVRQMNLFSRCMDHSASWEMNPKRTPSFSIDIEIHLGRGNQAERRALLSHAFATYAGPERNGI